jgi:hypothetical protein
LAAFAAPQLKIRVTVVSKKQRKTIEKMESLNDKWNPDIMKKEMEKSKEEFFKLTEQLMDVIAKFCVKALKAFEAYKGEEMNHAEINQVAFHEIEKIIEQVSDPKFSDLAVKKAETVYLEEKSNKNS